MREITHYTEIANKNTQIQLWCSFNNNVYLEKCKSKRATEKEWKKNVEALFVEFNV